MSCFGGRMQEYDRVSLDRFDGKNLQSTVYFLSHLHEDHAVGLAEDIFFRRLKSNKDIFLYCSEVTSVLIAASIKYQHLSPFVKSLDVNSPTTIVIPDPLYAEKEKVTVTFLPAFHCPGSVMILLEGEEGTVLYTGDFRWEHFNIEQMHHLRSGESVKRIKSLYVDTTFCTPENLHIPSRQQCIDAVCQLVQEWTVQSPQHVVYIYLRAQYGHEPLLNSVAVRLNKKVHVNEHKLSVYDRIHEFHGNFTSDGASTQLHACDRNCHIEVEGERMLCRDYHDPEKSLIVLPTTMYFTQFQQLTLDKIIKKISHNFYRACYSFHSSYTEVKDLISYLKPERAYANVKTPSDASLAVTQQRLNTLLRECKESGAGEIIQSVEEVKELGVLKTRSGRQVNKRKGRDSPSEADSLDFGSPAKAARHSLSQVESDSTPEATPGGTKRGRGRGRGKAAAAESASQPVVGTRRSTRRSAAAAGPSEEESTPKKTKKSARSPTPDIFSTPEKSERSPHSSFQGSQHSDSELSLLSSQKSLNLTLSNEEEVTTWTAGSFLAAISSSSENDETAGRICLLEDEEQTDEHFEDVSQITPEEEGEDQEGLTLQHLSTMSHPDLADDEAEFSSEIDATASKEKATSPKEKATAPKEKATASKEKAKPSTNKSVKRGRKGKNAKMQMATDSEDLENQDNKSEVPKSGNSRSTVDIENTHSDVKEPNKSAEKITDTEESFIDNQKTRKDTTDPCAFTGLKPNDIQKRNDVQKPTADNKKDHLASEDELHLHLSDSTVVSEKDNSDDDIVIIQVESVSGDLVSSGSVANGSDTGILEASSGENVEQSVESVKSDTSIQSNGGKDEILIGDSDSNSSFKSRDLAKVSDKGDNSKKVNITSSQESKDEMEGDISALVDEDRVRKTSGKLIQLQDSSPEVKDDDVVQDLGEELSQARPEFIDSQDDTEKELIEISDNNGDSSSLDVDLKSVGKPESTNDKNQVEATRESETHIKANKSQGENSDNEESVRLELKGTPSSCGDILKSQNTPVRMPATIQNNATLDGSHEDVPKTVNEKNTGEDDGDDDDVIEIVDLTGDDFAGHLDTQESGTVSKKTIKISLITKVEPKKDTGRKGDQKIPEKITSQTISKEEEGDTDSDADVNEISSSPEWLSVEKAVMSKPKRVHKKGKKKTSKYASFLPLTSTDACMTNNDSNNTDESESSAGLSKKEIEERAEVKRQAMGFVCETDSESDTDESSAPDSPGADVLYDDYVELTSSDSDNENGLSRKSKGRKSSSRNLVDSKKKGGNGKESGNRDWLNTKKQSHAVNSSDNQEKEVPVGIVAEIDKDSHVTEINENVISKDKSPCKDAMGEDKNSVPNSQDELSNQESVTNNIDTEKIVSVNDKDDKHDEAPSAESKEEKSESLPVDPEHAVVLATTAVETTEESKDKTAEPKSLENKEKSADVESKTDICIESAQQEANQIQETKNEKTTVEVSSKVDNKADGSTVLSDNVNNTPISNPSSESTLDILKKNEAINTVKTPVKSAFGDQPAPPGTEDPVELPGKPVKENPKDTSEKEEIKGSDTTLEALKTFYPLPPSDQPVPPGTEEQVSDTANKISPVISANRQSKKHNVPSPAWPAVPSASQPSSDNSSSSPLYNLFVAGKAAPPTFQPPPPFPPPYGYPPPPLGTAPNYPPPPLGQGLNYPYPPSSGWGPYSQNQYGNYPPVAYPQSYSQPPPNFPYTQPPPSTASNASSTYPKSSATTKSQSSSTYSKTTTTKSTKSTKTENNESQYVVSKPPVLNANYKPGSKTASKTFSSPHSSESQSKASVLDIPIPESNPEPKISQSYSKGKKLASWQQKKAEIFERGPSKIAKKELPKIKVNIGKPPSRLAAEQASQQSRQPQSTNPYSMTENMAQMVRQGVIKNEPVVDMSSIKANIAALTGIKVTTNPAPQQSEMENLPELMQRLKSLEKMQSILEAVSFKPEQQGQSETKQTFEYGHTHTGLNQPEYDKYRREDPYERRERRDSLPEEPRSRYDYDRERDRDYYDRREQDYERRLRDEEAYEHWLRDRRYDDYNRDRGLRPPPPRSHAYDSARYDDRPAPPRPVPRDAEYEEWLRRRRAGDPYRSRRDSYDRYDDFPPPPPRPRSPYDRPLSPYDRTLPPYDRPLPRSPIDRPSGYGERGYYDRDPYRGDTDRRTGVPDRYEPRYTEHTQSHTQSSNYSDSHYEAASSTAGQYQSEPRPHTYHQPTSHNEPVARPNEFVKKPLVARVLSRSGHLLSVQSASEALQHTQDYQ